MRVRVIAGITGSLGVAVDVGQVAITVMPVRRDVEPVISVPTWLALPLVLACGASEADGILCGSVLVVMVGGGIGRTEPPNISR